MEKGDSIFNLTSQQQSLATQRLTALWAFAESGLGGVMHAFQIPFTGLIIGGFAIIIITLLAKFSNNNLTQIFKSLIIVLLIKLTISPYTPFTAYIAVSFQAIIGYVLFSTMGVNIISITTLSMIAMLESAVQKLLILTLFFGQSFWKATNALFNFIAKQFHYTNINGNNWLVICYLSIYVIGGIGIARLSNKIINNFIFKIQLPSMITDQNESVRISQKKVRKKIIFFLTTLVILSVFLFIITPNKKDEWPAIVKTFILSLAIILAWFFFIIPLFTKLILRLFKPSKKKYHIEVAETLNVLPLIKKLSQLAWLETKQYKGFKRIEIFISTLLYWTLTYSEITFTKEIE